jgi:hypothetical protein
LNPKRSRSPATTEADFYGFLSPLRPDWLDNHHHNLPHIAAAAASTAAAAVSVDETGWFPHPSFWHHSLAVLFCLLIFFEFFLIIENLVKIFI